MKLRTYTRPLWATVLGWWLLLLSIWPLAPWDLHHRANGLPTIEVIDYLGHAVGFLILAPQWVAQWNHIGSVIEAVRKGDPID